MAFSVLPLLALLLLLALSAFALPFLALAEKRRAARLKRSLFEKSATQILLLAFLLQAFIDVALGADMLLRGCIDRQVPEVFRPLWSVTPALWGGAAFFALLGLLLGNRRGAGGRPAPARFTVPAFFSGLCATAAVAAMLIPAWDFLRAAQFASVPPDPQTGIILTVQRFFFREDPLLPALFFGSAPIIGYVAAQSVLLLWYILRRRSDDFGRDYYTLVVSSHARAATLACGLVLIPLAAAFLYLIPGFSLSRLPQMLPLPEARTMLVLNLLALALPLAALGWHFVSRSPVPLSRKFLIFPGPLLLWIWLFSLLSRLWL